MMSQRRLGARSVGAVLTFQHLARVPNRALVSGRVQLVRVDIFEMSVELDVIAEGVVAEVALDGH